MGKIGNQLKQKSAGKLEKYSGKKNPRKYWIKVVYLIGEKSVLAFLTVERRSIMNHFRMNFDLMNELHMVS